MDEQDGQQQGQGHGRAQQRAGHQAGCGQQAVPPHDLAIAETAQDGRGDRFHAQVAGKHHQQEQARLKGVHAEAELEHQGQQEGHTADGHPGDGSAEHDGAKGADLHG